MGTTEKRAERSVLPESDLFKRIGEESWTYIATAVDVVREPALILDKDLRVLAGNASFYRMFRVEPLDTERQIVYEIGNGQWNVPALRQLLEDILPHRSFFKGFEVVHNFPLIGRKVMILNARQIHREQHSVPGSSSPLILLAIEDVTDMMIVAESLAAQATISQAKLLEKTGKLEMHIGELKKEINKLKKRS